MYTPRQDGLGAQRLDVLAQLAVRAACRIRSSVIFCQRRSTSCVARSRAEPFAEHVAREVEVLLVTPRRRWRRGRSSFSRAVARRAQQFVQVLLGGDELLLGEPGEHRLFFGEKLKKRAAADVGGLGDLVHGRGSKALRAEQLDRGFKDPAPCLPCAFGGTARVWSRGALGLAGENVLRSFLARV